MGAAIVRFNSFWALFQDFSASLHFMINDLKRQLLDFSSSGRSERMEQFRCRFLELRNIDRCLRELSTEIAQLEESLVNFQITTVHVIKRIACVGANSLEDQEPYSLLLASLSVQTFKITEISKTLQRQITLTETIYRYRPSRSECHFEQ
ncbi:hypothetical protein DFJ43DRAFT_1157291 [Lentinula guzmanii]|uniref:Uncharacterized protein n=1 Tax=Lentinula guzmanii TaxID=2804957 RepID=A0AA38JFB1_9AGAR|nr:hypothetical protein DFJ43DRAFT_1157291 [Lentinula guzmanii]